MADLAEKTSRAVPLDTTLIDTLIQAIDHD
jgi:hypothetical protein